MIIILICSHCKRLFPQHTPQLYFVIDPSTKNLSIEEVMEEIYLPVKVQCPNCDKDLSKGKFAFSRYFYTEKLQQIMNFEPEYLQYNHFFITPEDKEKYRDQLISYSDQMLVFEMENTQPITVKLRRRIAVDKSDPLYKLVNRLYIVDKRVKKFKGNLDRMERGIRPIMTKIENRGTEAVPYLVRVLYNFDTWAAIFAAKLLGKIPDKRAIVPLMDAIEAPDAVYLNYQAMKALVNIGEPIVRPLIKRIKSRLEKPAEDESGNELDMSLLIGALSYIRSEKVYQFLQELLTDRDTWIYLDIPYLLWCLSNQGNSKIIPYIEEIAIEFEETVIGHSAEDALQILMGEPSPGFRLKMPRDGAEILNNGNDS